MKELKEEAKRHHEAKLHKYGASHEEAKKYAHGGHVHEVDLECKGKTGPEIKRAHGGKAGHPNREKDLHLIEELEHDHEKKRGGKVHHRAAGGPIPGGDSPRLGRGRKGKGKTQVNIAIGKPSGPDGGPTSPLPIGAGPGPAVPSAPPPRPIIPAAGAAPGVPPRPMPAPGPGVKHGGKVGHHSKHHEHGHKADHHKRHHRQQHH